MITARRSITIARSPEVVFDFMLDLSLASRWRPMISSMETVDGAPPREGSRITIQFWSGGREQTQTTTLDVCDRPRRQAYVTDARSFLLRVEFDLHADGPNTVVDLTARTVGQTLSTKLLIPLIRSGHRRRFRAMLEGLKREVEGRPQPAPPAGRPPGVLL
jgi:hypothetical protein